MYKRTLIKTAAAIAIAAIALVSLATPAYADALGEIKSRGTILAGIDPTFAPFEYTDANNKIIGYDAELIETIAKDWGVKVDYQVMAFSGIIPGLIANSFDLSVSALNVTAERAKRISYTVPIASTVNVVLTSKNNSKVKGTSMDDLSGLKCAVKQTAQPEQMMQELNKELSAAGKSEVELLSFDTVEQTISALVDNRVDCVVDDRGVMVAAMNARPSPDLVIIGNIGESALIAWGVNKSNPELTAAINETIIKLKKQGVLGKLQMKYFGYEIENLPEKNFIPSGD